LIALVVGGLAAFAVAGRGSGRLGLDLLLMLPLGTSAVTVGFGFLITLDQPPLDLRATWIIVPIAHALVAIPFVVRILVPVFRSLSQAGSANFGAAMAMSTILMLITATAIVLIERFRTPGLGEF